MACQDYTRRALLQGSAALFVGALAPKVSSAAGARDPRFIAVILRGALDGLSLAAPLGDPLYAEIRGEMAVERDAGLPLDGFFALNPRMPGLARLYAKGEALLVHAAATPYRERSHFDGQDVLESGLPQAGYRRSGWMNRLIAALPEVAARPRKLGFAAGAQLPLIMRGKAEVLSWMPPAFASASSDTKLRLLDIYRHTDPALAGVLEAGLELDDRTGGEMAPGSSARAMSMDGLKGGAQLREARAAAAAAGTLIAAPEGPRIGVLDLNGFDTHANQKPIEGQLGGLLAGLDAIMASFAQTLAPVWSDTIVAFLTEFGRTVHVNGTAGTDHGTATAAVFIGGALKGGRILADWPGLRPADLHEGRDLKPTIDLRAPLKGLAAEHLGIPLATLDQVVFPESAAVKPLY
jgi:uncharacterized protein (DUF1501 family)